MLRAVGRAAAESSRSKRANAGTADEGAHTEWGEGCDIFTPAAELDPAGWLIRRARPSRR